MRIKDYKGMTNLYDYQKNPNSNLNTNSSTSLKTNTDANANPILRSNSNSKLKPKSVSKSKWKLKPNLNINLNLNREGSEGGDGCNGSGSVGGSQLKRRYRRRKENVYEMTWDEEEEEELEESTQSLTHRFEKKNRMSSPSHLKNSKSISSLSFQKSGNPSNTEKDKNKIKKMFSGLGNQMKNAMNVFGEVREQLKSTANEAKKNMNNYPFCTAPCSIENLKNTIYINEGEIVIKKNIYGSLFKKNNSGGEESLKKKKESEKEKDKDIFTCSKNDILIRGKYNFGFHVELNCENEGNKIIAHAYDKVSHKRIPCYYKWKRISANKTMTSFQNIHQHHIQQKKNNIYDNEYELTCEDIGYKICVECWCINDEQITMDMFSKISINNFDSSENEIHDSFRNIGGGNYDANTEENLEDAKDYSSSYRNRTMGKFESKTTVDSFFQQKGVTSETFNDMDVPMKYIYKDTYRDRGNEGESEHVTVGAGAGKNGVSVNRMVKDAAEVFPSYKSTCHNNDLLNGNKYFGVAEAEIGPFTLNVKTKKMLEAIISNDTIRYPIYIIKKMMNGNCEIEFGETGNCNNSMNKNYYNNINMNDVNNLNNMNTVTTSNNNSSSNKYNNNNNNNNNNNLNKFGGFNNNNNINVKASVGDLYEDNSYAYSVESDSVFSSSIKQNGENENDNENDSENEIYMLYIHRNEIKIIGQNRKTKNMWCYKFQQIYPYIEFLENSYFFHLHVSPKEYFLCKCLYKRHIDLITLLLRYMHANLYIINDYIFNNINSNFEDTKISDICDNVNVNSILESLKKELIINQKMNRKYILKINSLQREKNSLEEELKSTIEAFQMQLDVKKFNDDKDLISTNARLMKEVTILQQKFKGVDTFFKNKYKILVDENEKYKKLVEENKGNVNTDYVNEMSKKLEALEREKNEILNKYIGLNNCYNEEQCKKKDAEKKMESMNAEINYLLNTLQTEKAKGMKNDEYAKEIEMLKENNIVLQQLHLKAENDVNLLTTEKNRLSKLVNSLTKDIEKLKSLENTKRESINSNNKNISVIKNAEKDKLNNGTILNSSLDNEKLLKEIQALKSENELLKTRIKKIAKLNKA